MVKIGDTIEITTDNYGEKWIGKKCKVTHVAYNKEQHPGYDEGVNIKGEPPMALVDTDCKKLGSLYEYEFDVI
jgi:hypothetical protein